MRELPAITPDFFEILAVRELRKAGFDVNNVQVHRRSELPEPESGFVLELVVTLTQPGTAWAHRALVVCRRQGGAVARDVVESARVGLSNTKADVAIVFATADFGADTLAAAQQGGVALLRVVDGRNAFDAGGWNTPGGTEGGQGGHYPAWLPAYLAQLVDRDIAGAPRARLLEPGRPEMILDCFRVESRP